MRVTACLILIDTRVILSRFFDSPDSSLTLSLYTHEILELLAQHIDVFLNVITSLDSYCEARLDWISIHKWKKSSSLSCCLVLDHRFKGLNNNLLQSGEKSQQPGPFILKQFERMFFSQAKVVHQQQQRRQQQQDVFPDPFEMLAIVCKPTSELYEYESIEDVEHILNDTSVHPNKDADKKLLHLVASRSGFTKIRAPKEDIDLEVVQVNLSFDHFLSACVNSEDVLQIPREDSSDMDKFRFALRGICSIEMQPKHSDVTLHRPEGIHEDAIRACISGSADSGKHAFLKQLTSFAYNPCKNNNDYLLHCYETIFACLLLVGQQYKITQRQLAGVTSAEQYADVVNLVAQLSRFRSFIRSMNSNIFLMRENEYKKKVISLWLSHLQNAAKRFQSVHNVYHLVSSSSWGVLPVSYFMGRWSALMGVSNSSFSAPPPQLDNNDKLYTKHFTDSITHEVVNHVVEKKTSVFSSISKVHWHLQILTKNTAQQCFSHSLQFLFFCVPLIDIKNETHLFLFEQILTKINNHTFVVVLFTFQDKLPPSALDMYTAVCMTKFQQAAKLRCLENELVTMTISSARSADVSQILSSVLEKNQAHKRELEAKAEIAKQLEKQKDEEKKRQQQQNKETYSNVREQKSVLSPSSSPSTSLLLQKEREKMANWIPEGVYFDQVMTNIATSLGLWDTMGQSDYDRLRPLSYPQTDVFLLCFSVTDKVSLAHVIEKWQPEITLHCPEAPFLLVGLKSDLREDVEVLERLKQKGESTVDPLDAQDTAENLGAVTYCECSALTQKDLKQVMDYAMIAAINTQLKKRRMKQNGMVNLKCVLVGDGGVGKTSLLISYTTNAFPGEYIPTVFDNYSSNVLLSGGGPRPPSSLRKGRSKQTQSGDAKKSKKKDSSRGSSKNNWKKVNAADVISTSTSSSSSSNERGVGASAFSSPPPPPPAGGSFAPSSSLARSSAFPPPPSSSLSPSPLPPQQAEQQTRSAKADMMMEAQLAHNNNNNNNNIRSDKDKEFRSEDKREMDKEKSKQSRKKKESTSREEEADMEERKDYAKNTMQQDQVRAVMDENIAVVLNRGERIEMLMEQSEDLSAASYKFSKSSTHVQNRQRRKKLLFGCCMLPVFVAAVIVGVVPFVMYWTGKKAHEKFKNRNKGTNVDDVFADMENIFNGLSSFLLFCSPPAHTFLQHRCLCIQKCNFKYFLRVFFWSFPLLLVVYVCVSVFAVIVLLPCIFVLLVVRTAKVERSVDEGFAVRQEVLSTESKAKKSLRVFSLLIRAFPMLCLIVIYPLFTIFFICYHFPMSAKYVIGVQLSLLAVLQCLGTVRGLKSWIEANKEKEIKQGTARLCDISKEKLPSSRLPLWVQFPSAQQRGENSSNNKNADKEDEGEDGEEIFLPLDTLSLSSPSNWLVSLSVLLEAVQLGLFSLEFDTDSTANAVYSAIFIKVESFVPAEIATAVSSSALYVAWACVVALVLLFCIQFLTELRGFGQLKRAGEQDAANKYFFHSFVGAIIYGHGQLKGVASWVAISASLLSDGLFLIVAQYLIEILVCKDSERCWQGDHLWKAAVSLVALSFYVPLCVMIGPLLAESTSGGSAPPAVRMAQPFLSLVAVMKFILLLTASFFTQDADDDAKPVCTFLLCFLCFLSLLGWGTKTGTYSMICGSKTRGVELPVNPPALYIFRTLCFACGMWGALVALIMGALVRTKVIVSHGSDITLLVLIIGLIVIGLFGIQWWLRWKSRHTAQKNNLALLAKILQGQNVAQKGLAWRSQPLEAVAMDARLRVSNGKWTLEK